MVKAAKEAKQAKEDFEREHHETDFEREHHETFLFKHARVLLHELGHMFITYLSRGRERDSTPPTMNAPTHFEPSMERGEAGRKLEGLVFGGTLDFFTYAVGETREDAVCSLMVAPVQGQSVGI